MKENQQCGNCPYKKGQSSKPPKSPIEVMKELRRTSERARNLAQLFMQAATPEYMSLAKNMGNVYTVLLTLSCEVENAANVICGGKGGAV